MMLTSGCGGSQRSAAVQPARGRGAGANGEKSFLTPAPRGLGRAISSPDGVGADGSAARLFDKLASQPEPQDYAHFYRALREAGEAEHDAAALRTARLAMYVLSAAQLVAAAFILPSAARMRDGLDQIMMVATAVGERTARRTDAHATTLSNPPTPHPLAQTREPSAHSPSDPP